MTTVKPVYSHATAVLIGTSGLLIQGPSRSGKSSLALALLANAEALSWQSRLIGDDRVSVERDGGKLILRGHPAILGKIEQRGVGILDRPWAAFAVASYVIDLAAKNSGSGALTAERWTEIHGIALPLLTLPPGLTADRDAKLIINHLNEAEALSLRSKAG